MENSGGIVYSLRLYNDFENWVRNLKCLDVETSAYGCLLIPILKTRLSDNVILLVSRKFEENYWQI